MNLNTHAAKCLLLEMFPIGPEVPDHRRMDPVSAIVGGIGAVTSIIGGFKGKSAAEKAAAIQKNAAIEAGKKVVDTAAAVNPQIGETAERVATDVEGAGRDANERLDPWRTVGTKAVNALDLQVEKSSKAPTMADLEIDPGFAFRLKEGLKAVSNSAAAKGGAISGGTIKATERFAQDYSSDEYEKAFQRYRQNRGDTFTELKSLSDTGLSAADKQGGNTIDTTKFGGALRVDATGKMTDNTINAAKTEGEYITQGANADAAGIVSGANSVNQGLNGASSSMMNALLLGTLAKTKAKPPTSAGPANGNYF